MTYLLNALPGGALIGRTGTFRTITDAQAREILAGEWESAVGHESTALALSAWADIDIPFARRTITVYPGDRLLVAALRGPRLYEGEFLSLEEVKSRGWEWLLVEIN